MLKYVFALISSCLLLGCVREEIVEIDTNHVEEKLVVFGLLTPGDYIYIRVGRSQAFTSKNYQDTDFQLKHAVVTIRPEDGLVRPLEAVGNQGLYRIAQSELPVIPGKTYSLEVEAAGMKPVSAHTTVPKHKAIWKEAAIHG